MKEKNNVLGTIGLVLLGLLMLVAGLGKLLGPGAPGVSEMLSGIFLFSWAPLFWAWVLIILEIGSGLAILAKFKLEYTAYIPVIILGVATLFMGVQWSSIGQTNWMNLIFHLFAIVGYLELACKKC